MMLLNDAHRTPESLPPPRTSRRAYAAIYRRCVTNLGQRLPNNPLAQGFCEMMLGSLKVGQDVIERRSVAEARRACEERVRQVDDASADTPRIPDAETLDVEYLSPAAETAYGVSPDDLLSGTYMVCWVGLIVHEDRELAVDHVRRVRHGEDVLNTAHSRLRADRDTRWIRGVSFPSDGATGRVQRIGAIDHEATEATESKDRLRVLVAELQHRTRNLLGVVQSVTDKTLASSTSLPDFQGRIRDRLNALARVNGLLSRLDGGGGITFGELILAELMAHGVADIESPGSQVKLRGPEGIRLRSSTVQTLALGLHELATNALKHGALSRPEGRLEVTWGLLGRANPVSSLWVDWRESGVPVPSPGDEPATAPRRGYGRELIERALPYELQAETYYQLTPDGVRCTITLPVSSTMDMNDPVPETFDA